MSIQKLTNLDCLAVSGGAIGYCKYTSIPTDGNYISYVESGLKITTEVCASRCALGIMVGCVFTSTPPTCP